MNSAIAYIHTAVAYVRVSSEEQAKAGFSLDAQEEKVRAYARLRDLDISAVYREEGVSGKVAVRDRPEGSKLVEDISRGRAKHIITVKLDRLFRNAQDALDQAAKWDKAKCTLHIIDMGGSSVDTSSAMGRMFFTMAAAFAEMERNLTSERTKAALSHKRATKRVYTRITPFGFDRTPDTQVGDRRVTGDLIANAKEMLVVERIKMWRKQGIGMREIARRLNADSVPTKLGGTWYAVTVQKILKIHV